jgi:hypothetical protein
MKLLSQLIADEVQEALEREAHRALEAEIYDDDGDVTHGPLKITIEGHTLIERAVKRVLERERRATVLA